MDYLEQAKADLEDAGNLLDSSEADKKEQALTVALMAIAAALVDISEKLKYLAEVVELR